MNRRQWLPLLFSAAITLSSTVGNLTVGSLTTGPNTAWGQDQRPTELGSVASARPIAATSPTPIASSVSTTTSCKAELETALLAFQRGDYDVALDRVTQGLAVCPGDNALHQFRELIVFAKGDYAEASVLAHKAVGSGTGLTWATIYPVYPDVQTYTKHLRALESFTKKHPDDGAARFLQAYHYRALGSTDAAVRELEMVIRLEYNDITAVNLLRNMGRSATSPAPITRTAIGTY